LVKETHIKIKASADGLKTSRDKVGCTLSDPVKRLWPDDVGVGVTIGKGTLSLCMLAKRTIVSDVASTSSHHDVRCLTSSLFKVVNMVLRKGAVSFICLFIAPSPSSTYLLP
jgi:hypothetical protein